MSLALLGAVSACGGGGGGSAATSGSPPGQTPDTETPTSASPALLTRAGDTDDSALVRWTDAGGPGPWTLERWHEGDAAPVVLATVSAREGVFADTGLAASTAYVYRLRDAAGSVVLDAPATTGDAPALRSESGPAVGTAQALVLGPGAAQATAGAVMLSYPAGTFSGTGGARVQAHEHGLADGVGQAWTIELDETPQHPLTVALAYGADEEVDDVENQQLAARTADGHWWVLTATQHDRAAKRLSVTLPAALLQGATTWPVRTVSRQRSVAQASASVLRIELVRFVGLKMVPREASVRVLGTVALQPVATWQVKIDDCDADSTQLCVPMVGLAQRDYPMLNTKSGFERRWLLEGSTAAAPELGSLTPGEGAGAVYRAPAQVPSVNPVTVRFESLDIRRGRRSAVSARVRVSEDSWVGPMVLSNSVDGLGYFYDSDTRWVLDPQRSTDSVRVYRAQGTVKVHLESGTCPLTALPDQATLGAAAGLTELEVDEITDRYRVQFNAVWPTTISNCHGTSMPTSLGVNFDQRGQVAGGRIQGTHQEGTVFRQWNLSRP